MYYMYVERYITLFSYKFVPKAVTALSLYGSNYTIYRSYKSKWFIHITEGDLWQKGAFLLVTTTYVHTYIRISF